jgi:hypothetical protein
VVRLCRGGPVWMCQFRYGDPVVWTVMTAIGTVLAGFALPLAFIQLGGCARIGCGRR